MEKGDFECSLDAAAVGSPDSGLRFGTGNLYQTSTITSVSGDHSEYIAAGRLGCSVYGVRGSEGVELGRGADMAPYSSPY